MTIKQALKAYFDIDDNQATPVSPNSGRRLRWMSIFMIIIAILVILMTQVYRNDHYQQSMRTAATEIVHGQYQDAAMTYQAAHDFKRTDQSLRYYHYAHDLSRASQMISAGKFVQMTDKSYEQKFYHHLAAEAQEIKHPQLKQAFNETLARITDNSATQG